VAAEGTKARPGGQPMMSLNARLPSRRRWPVLVLLGMATMAGCASLEEQQRKLIFMPAPASAASLQRQAFQADGVDDVWIELRSAASGKPARLHALWLAHPEPAAPVLLYLHGARRNVGDSLFRIRNMQALGFAVLAVDYRGFGQSSDELPSEAMVYEDARAAWEWLARRHPRRDRYIFGHSLGGAIAVQLASEVDDAKGMIVEGSFTSIPAVVKTMRWGWLPLGPLITQRFDAAEKIGKIKVPVLVVHGDSDTLIRPELGRELFERATAPKRFVLVEGGTHYNTNSIARPLYRDALQALFGLRS
jgi:uncharacterized protein